MQATAEDTAPSLNDVNARLDNLVLALNDATQKENEAKEIRAAIEKQILDIVGSKEKGAYTYKTLANKITTTGKLNTSIDWKKYSQIEEQIPAHLRPIKETVKRELDEKGINYLRNNEPEVFKIIAECLSTKPGKTSLKVTPLG